MTRWVPDGTGVQVSPGLRDEGDAMKAKGLSGGATWVADGGVTTGADVGGDRQIGDAYSVRYRLEGDRARVVDVHYYVAQTASGDSPGGARYGVRHVTEYTILNDPDDWDSEEWREEHEMPFHLHDHEREEDARTLAHRAAETHVADYISWDGERDVVGWPGGISSAVRERHRGAGVDEPVVRPVR